MAYNPLNVKTSFSQSAVIRLSKKTYSYKASDHLTLETSHNSSVNSDVDNSVIGLTNFGDKPGSERPLN